MTGISGLLAILGAVYAGSRFLFRNIWVVEDRRRELGRRDDHLVIAGASGGLLLAWWERSQPSCRCCIAGPGNPCHLELKDAWIKRQSVASGVESPHQMDPDSVLPDARGSILTADEIFGSP
jgi:hypothetical protein